MRVLLITLTSLLGLCRGAHRGTEFVTIFMENFKSNYKNSDVRLLLLVNGYEADTAVTVRVRGAKEFHQELALGPGETGTVEVTPCNEVTGSQLTTKTVTVSADKGVTVTSVSIKPLSTDTAVVPPLCALGTTYYVFTPPTGPKAMFKEFGVVNAGSANRVTVKLSQAVQFEGHLHPKGNTLTFSLAPYQSALFQSQNDLTGTKVEGLVPFALVSGHSCSMVRFKCNHVYEHLPPVERWGTEYVAVPTSSQRKYDQLYVVASERTVVKASTERTPRTLKEGEASWFKLSRDWPVVLSADKPVMVLHFSPGGKTSRNTGYDPFLTVLAPSRQFANSYVTQALHGFQNFLTVVAPTGHTGHVLLDQREIGAAWKTVPNTEYSWAEVELGSEEGRHEVRAADNVTIGVYVHGMANMNGYGSQGNADGQQGSDDPCSLSQCGGLPHCARQNHSVCWAFGDPHYRTFDGVVYDFQGTCSYTFAKSCVSDPSVPAFSIHTRNDNRGSSRVSLTMMVTVEVYGHTITALKSELGRVRIDGVKASLPLKLVGGKVEVSQSGAYVLLETDFHLRVLYDWDHHLMVRAPRLYSGKLCGLCGNYDGDVEQEFSTPSGALAPTPLEFGRSWRLDEVNASCWDDCHGPCSACEARDQAWERGNASCGLLAQAGGPFHECHSTFEPQHFVRGCAHDLCRSQGLHRFLCQAMKAYAELCQREGLRIHEWRSLVKCPLQCPDNSHYEACGTPCPATCMDPSAPAKCQRPCVESCVCDSGYLLSAGKCVPEGDCGCGRDGRYYKAGESFWEDEGCQTWCECDPQSKRVECWSQACGHQERCEVVKGLRRCQPLSYGTCTAVGDPHYHTFDSLKFDFMGTCVYLLAGLCANGTGLTPFEVQVQNENRGNKAVSFTRLGWVIVYGQNIVLSREHVGKALVDGILKNLPISLQDGKINIYKSCRGASLEVDFGLHVNFDFRSRITVTVPGTYAGSVCGLCGNFDGELRDEMMLRDGTLTDDPVEFGQSWQVASTPGCAHECRGRCPKCDIVAARRYESSEQCGKIRAPQGPFRDCLGTVDPTPYLDDCTYDSCLYKGHHTILCESLASYAAACQDTGAHIAPWRNQTFCPMPCPPHSHYEPCGTACPLTCCTLTDSDSCNATCAEGCQCDDGFVLSGEDCVPLGECGCLHRGIYYRLDEVFYPSGQCGERCRCQEGGSVACEEIRCGSGEVCKVVEGVRGCHALTPGSCTISGDLHHYTFDGMHFNYQGSCTYLLAKVCQQEQALPNFNVTVTYQTLADGAQPVTRFLELQVYGYALTLERGVPWKVQVNGVLTNVPLRLGGDRLLIQQLGRDTVIQTDFGLRLSYDLSYSARVIVPGRYRALLCGLCGNFNGDEEDEFLTPQKVVAPGGVNDMAASWSSPRPGEVCHHGSQNTRPVCAQSRRTVLESDNYCGFLTSPSSPLAVCHSTVPPEQYFGDCVFDTCWAEGDTQVMCASVTAYLGLCQSMAGIDLSGQVHHKLCMMKCAENSHYEACADTCHTTCAGVTDFSKCPQECHEGCQCDEGFYANGDACVPIEECGCFQNGRYYQPDEVAIDDGCKQRCTCSLLGLSCEEMACTAEEVCEVRNTVRGCYHQDPCKAAKCRAKEVCELTDTGASCVAESTVKCRVWGRTHHQTFDGYEYELPGTFTYVLSERCGTDHTLSPFRIEAKNEKQGNTGASYIRTIHIHANSYTVSIHQGEPGKVRVDSVLVPLPVTLSDGKLHVEERGGQAVLESAFGLRVSYDWAWHLTIEVPSSYFRNTCGLCGNFDGNAQDEMTFSNGTVVNTVWEWASGWKAHANEELSYDSCSGHCPECSRDNRQLYQGDGYCGALRTLFEACQDKVDHAPFLRACIDDVCLNHGRRNKLCQALSAYANECQKQAVNVTDWRQLMGCPYECPVNSHYSPCGTACPLTCERRDPVPSCPVPCQEGCECDDGYVLVGGQCQTQSSCRCQYRGRFYPPGERFWVDERCQGQCKCDGDLGMVVCEQTQCGHGELCQIRDGHQDCYPSSQGVCTVYGNLHYQTFDGLRYQLSRGCTYHLLVMRGNASSSLTPVQVTVENTHKGSSLTSYTSAVTLHLYGTTLVLSMANPGKITVDGVLISLPYSPPHGRFSAYRSGRLGVVSAGFGLRLTFDWHLRLTLALPNTYSGSVQGLCGDFDGQTEGELLQPDGQPASDAQEFGEAWMVEGSARCDRDCAPNCPLPRPDAGDSLSGVGRCGVLQSPTGPFRDCLEKVDPEPYHQDCALDVSLRRGHQGALCDALTVYTAACQEAGFTVHPWRNATFCPLTCQSGSHYQLSGEGCPATCYNLLAPRGCQSLYQETCQCDDGYALSGEECVPLSECGCASGGMYYRPGEVTYRGQSCQEQCTCQPDGSMECVLSSCREGEVCRQSGGVLGCRPAGTASCQATGHQHYRTFDGRSFNLMVGCASVLAKVATATAGLPHFTVMVGDARAGSGDLHGALSRSVTVEVGGHQITMWPGVTSKVQVDGEVYHLPVQLRSRMVMVTQEGNAVVLRTQFGLRVVYDALSYLEVNVSSSYQGQLAGLCGNYNGQQNDDLLLPTGEGAANLMEFVTSWRVQTAGGMCSVSYSPLPPGCDAHQQQIYSTPSSCGLLTDSSGPFAACAQIVEPSSFYQSCLHDVCTANGSHQALCRNLQGYATACQQAGGQLHPWRDSNFCPLSCPAHSQYEVCAETCAESCSELIEPGDCEGVSLCSEGCECEPGYALSGSDCVPAETCGCSYQERYLQVDDKVYGEDCLELCTCYDTGYVECQEVSCPPTQSCLIRKGIRGCYTKEGVCSITQGRSLLTFDDQSAEIHAPGVYVLASICNETAPGWFQALVQFRPCLEGGELSVSALFLHFDNAFIAVTVDRNIWVNGRAVKWHQLPYRLILDVTIRSEADAVIVEHSSGVWFKLSAVGELPVPVTVTVTVPESFRRQMCGTCGMFGASYDGELPMPDGSVTADIPCFLTSWLAPEFTACLI